MKKYLLIGKNGYIAKQFLNSNIENIQCTTSNINDNDDIYLDLKNPEAFDYNNIDKDMIVVLLAAISSPDMCLNDYDNSYAINVTGTKYFIEKVLQRKAKVLFFSSDTIYGETINEVNEKTAINPLGNYAKMKAEIEKSFVGHTGFKVFRLSYVLSKNDKYLQYLINCIKNKEIAEVFDPLDRSVIYIKDVVDAIISISHKWESFSSSIINLGGESLTSRKNIAEFINENWADTLKFKIITPNADFFKARPRVINMKSLYLNELLEHKPTSVKDAVKYELEGMI